MPVPELTPAELHDQDLARRIARAELWRRVLVVSIVLTFAVLIGGVLWLSAQIRQTQQDGSPVGRRLVSLSETINGCVNPGGECFQRSQERQSNAVAMINLGALYGAYCVQHNPDATPGELKRCVERLYKRDQANQ